MSKFGEYLFENIGVATSDNSIDNISTETGLDKEVVESIVALVNKTLTDWNREKQIEGKKIEKVVYDAIKSNLINVV